MKKTDGRDTRWAEHRLARRAELVECTLRAIRRHGAGVGMDEIATEASTSKTVLYRHFGDKFGLYLAVAASVDRLILRDLGRALRAGGLPNPPPPPPPTDPPTDPATVADRIGLEKPSALENPRALVEAAVDAYLALVEADPEVYRFVVAHPLLDRPVDDDPVSGLTTRIADDVADLLAAALTATGREAGDALTSAQTIAHGLVGLVQSAADRWISAPDPAPRSDLVRHLSLLIWGGLSAVLDPPEDS